MWGALGTSRHKAQRLEIVGGRGNLCTWAVDILLPSLSQSLCKHDSCPTSHGHEIYPFWPLTPISSSKTRGALHIHNQAVLSLQACIVGGMGDDVGETSSVESSGRGGPDVHPSLLSCLGSLKPLLPKLTRSRFSLPPVSQALKETSNFPTPLRVPFS